MKRINKTAEIKKIIQEDLEKIAAASTKSILFTCPDCQRVTVDPADVAALEADNKRLRKLADAVLVFAEEFGLDSWVVDDEAEGCTGTPELKLDAAITEYKEAKR